MSLSVGIVGLPNVGKSTLFNALLKKQVAYVANYPFATIEPNIGVVPVPDERLEKLADVVARELNPSAPSITLRTGSLGTSRPPIVPAVVQFVDIAGLVKGASIGAGLGNQFLSHIREVDAIIHVLRDFEDTEIIREGSENPKSDREVVETELALADLQVIEKLIDNQSKTAKESRDPLDNLKVNLLKEFRDQLEKGEMIGGRKMDDERLVSWFKTLPLLTTKPVLYIYNVSEKEYSEKIKNNEEGDKIIISAKLEGELADYSEEERLEYLQSLGIDKTGLERLIIKAYELLGLISYLTAGPKEVRAWTIKKGMLAPQAAGVIHTDFEKKFISAEVISAEELLAAGGFKVAKQKGKIRIEGKNYPVVDGDVIEFNVGS